MDALIYHIDDCTRPSNRRLLAIDVCTALVFKKSEQQDEWGGTTEDHCLSTTTLVEAFRAALVRRLSDPCNVSLHVNEMSYIAK